MACAVALASLSLVGIEAAGAPTAKAAPTAVVVPNSLATTYGNGSNAFPFHCGAVFSSQRYQQVYAGGQVGSGSITQLAFRPKFDAFSATVIPNVTITLSTTTKALTGLDTTFANNIGADVKTVFSGNLTLSSPGGSFSQPNNFVIVIPLQTPFTFSSGGGNLLLDVTIPTCQTTGAFDADFQNQPSPISMARVFTQSTGSSSTSGIGDTSGQFGGLVTKFTFGTAGGPCLTGSYGGSLTLGGGSSCLNGASVGGNLTFPPGANVTITNSKIGGSVTGSGGGAFSLCGSSVGGNVGISGASGFVLIGDPGDDKCASNTVGGSVSLTSNNAGVEVSQNTRISGNVTLNNNTGGGPFPEDTRPEVEANIIGGTLSCSGNTPAPTNDGQPNSRAGASGQCVGL
jgi:hypothetical protein